MASTFNTAKTPNASNEYSNYYVPEMVNKLMENPNPPKMGPLEAIAEIPSENDYYDGSLNLNKVKVKCFIHTSVADCTGQNGCGWCGSEHSCIFGTKTSPLQACVKSTYIGALRHPSFIPQVKKIDEPVGGVTKTIINNHE